MASQTITLSKSDIKAAILQAALTSAGVNPGTPNLITAVKLAETLDVFVGADFRATVTIMVPGS